MNGYGQQINPMALWEALENFNKVQDREQTRQRMMSSGNPYMALGASLGNVLAGKFGKNQNAEAKYLEEQFKYNQQVEAQKAEAMRRQAEQQRALMLEDEARKRGYEVEDRDFNAANKKTDAMRNLEARGLKAGTPEYNQAMGAYMQKTNSVNVNSGKKDNRFVEKTMELNAGKLNKWEEEAYNANEVNEKLNALEQIGQLQETGKMQEAMAMSGQWFGSESGANMQSFQASQKSLMLDAASKLKGAMSEGEWKVLQQMMPDFGNDPAANQFITTKLREAAQRTMTRHQEAMDYVTEHGRLQGFKPSFMNQKHKEQPQEKSNAVEMDGKKYIQKDGQWFEL